MIRKILKYAELQNNYFMTYNMGSIIFINEIIPKKKLYFFTAGFLILKFKKSIQSPTANILNKKIKHETSSMLS